MMSDEENNAAAVDRIAEAVASPERVAAIALHRIIDKVNLAKIPNASEINTLVDEYAEGVEIAVYAAIEYGIRNGADETELQTAIADATNRFILSD